MYRRLRLSTWFTIQVLLVMSFLLSCKSISWAKDPDSSIPEHFTGIYLKGYPTGTMQITYRESGWFNFPPLDKKPWNIYKMDEATYLELANPALGQKCHFLKDGGVLCGPINFSPWANYAHKRILANYPSIFLSTTSTPTVLFSVHNRDGAVDHLQIVNSSGSKVKDQAALEAIKKAAPFGPFPKRTVSIIWARYKFSAPAKPPPTSKDAGKQPEAK